MDKYDSYNGLLYVFIFYEYMIKSGDVPLEKTLHYMRQIGMEYFKFNKQCKPRKNDLLFSNNIVNKELFDRWIRKQCKLFNIATVSYARNKNRLVFF